MARKKINWLLILQGWAMLWVVIGHSPLKMDDTMPMFAKALYDIAYSFHMPLFILVSGYLFYMTRLVSSVQPEWGGTKWPYGAIMIDKLKRLGIPFVVFTIIAMAMKVLFPGDMARPASFTLQEFIHAILYPREGPLLEMWFVAVIMWMFALAPLWKICLKSKYLSFVVLIIMFSLRLFADELSSGTFLCLKDTMRLGVYFYIGMLACKYGFDDRYQRYKYIIIAIAAVLYLGCFYINFDFGVSMSGISLSIGLAFAFDKYVPKAFSSFRDYTYQIFLISIFAQIAIKMIYKRISLMDIGISQPILVYVIFFILCLLAGLYVPVIISKVAERVNWSPVLLSLGLKKK